MDKPIEPPPPIEPGNDAPENPPAGHQPPEPVAPENAAPAPENAEPDPNAAPEPEPEPEYVVALRQELSELKEAMETKLKAQAEPPAPAAPADPTPADWLEIERTMGFTRGKDEASNQEFINVEPRKLISGMREMIRAAVAHVTKEFEGKLHGNVSEIRFNAVVEGMAGKHTDIRQYTPMIKEYLKRYEPQDRSNEKYILDGLWWAKGQKAKAAVAAAQDSTRRNARVVTPANNRGGGRAPGGQTPLTPGERALIAAGEFKDETELRRWKNADMSKI